MIARVLVLAAVGCPLVSVTMMAQRQTLTQMLTLTPATSEVHFELGDVLHAVHGTFKVRQGSILFGRDEGPMSGMVMVDAASGNSGNGSRDKKMTKDELQAPTYSMVTFAPKRHTGMIHAAGDSTIVVDGTFTLLGTPHAITVPMQVHIDGTECKATGTFTVPYVQWGLKDPSNFLLHVGKEVKIDLDLFGSLSEKSEKIGSGAES